MQSKKSLKVQATEAIAAVALTLHWEILDEGGLRCKLYTEPSLPEEAILALQDLAGQPTVAPNPQQLRFLS